MKLIRIRKKSVPIAIPYFSSHDLTRYMPGIVGYQSTIGEIYRGGVKPNQLWTCCSERLGACESFLVITSLMSELIEGRLTYQRESFANLTP